MTSVCGQPGKRLGKTKEIDDDQAATAARVRETIFRGRRVITSLSNGQSL